MYIERSLEKKVREYLKDKEVIAIVGARQSGKTTLMKEIFKGLKNAQFVSFEDRDILELFSSNIKEFIKKFIENTDFLFIDEFQYAKEGGKNLKFLYDNYNAKIVISGSSVAELSIQSIKYLVGRVFVFTLHPFSFEEFFKYKDSKLYEIFKETKISETSVRAINEIYQEYLLYGGYPRVIIEKDETKKIEILKNIYNTYLLKEIKEILQIEDDEKINKIIKSLALQVGNLINFNELSSFTNIGFHQLKKYIEIIKKTFICFEVKPYFRNKRKEIVKSPKIYFLDSGFRNIAIGNFQNLKERTDIGPLNENFVASELFKKEIPLNYWRTKAGAEIDFIIEKDNKLIPIEVKTVLKSPKYGKAFKSLINEYNPKEGFILSQEYYNKIQIVNTKIEFMPLFCVSKLITHLTTH